MIISSETNIIEELTAMTIEELKALVGDLDAHLFPVRLQGVSRFFNITDLYMCISMFIEFKLPIITDVYCHKSANFIMLEPP